MLLLIAELHLQWPFTKHVPRYLAAIMELPSDDIVWFLVYTVSSYRG